MAVVWGGVRFCALRQLLRDTLSSQLVQDGERATQRAIEHGAIKPKGIDLSVVFNRVLVEAFNRVGVGVPRMAEGDFAGEAFWPQQKTAELDGGGEDRFCEVPGAVRRGIRMVVLQNQSRLVAMLGQ